jgi:hypothetical protein
VNKRYNVNLVNVLDGTLVHATEDKSGNTSFPCMEATNRLYDSCTTTTKQTMLSFNP